MCRPNLLNSGGGSEIKAKAKRYDRANHKGLLDVGRATVARLAGEVEATKGVGFPEINPGT